jgi:SAM-dependent methyltransferase
VGGSVTREALLCEQDLEALDVVANSKMNRERELQGSNGYGRELGFDVISVLRERGEGARWLDICCGSGRALAQAAEVLPSVHLEGLDLVPYFSPAAISSRVHLTVGPIRTFQPTPGGYDLITCVHGLHYVGDKLAALDSMRSWLRRDGRMAATLDPGLVLFQPEEALDVIGMLRRWGFRWDGRRRLVSARGSGARIDRVERLFFAGGSPGVMSYTGQPAVGSHYVVGG